MKLIIITFLFMVSSAALASTADIDMSSVTWEGGKILGDKHNGTIPILNSSFELNKKNKIKSGEMVISIADFKVADLKGKLAKKFVGHMKSADFFNVDKWPTAKIEIQKMKKGKGRGLLTIKDKTQKIKFKYTEDAGLYKGSFVIDRTKFNMTYGSGNFFKNLGDKVIKDEVVVGFNITCICT